MDIKKQQKSEINNSNSKKNYNNENINSSNLLEKISFGVIIISAIGFFYPHNDKNVSFIPKDTFFDATHFPIFILLTISIYYLEIKFKIIRTILNKIKNQSLLSYYQNTNKILIASIFTFTLAILIEILQPIVGRSFSFKDILNDLVGIGLGFWFLKITKNKHSFNSIILFTATSISLFLIVFHPAIKEIEAYMWQKENFPVLSVFKNKEELTLWKPYEIEADTETKKSLYYSGSEDKHNNSYLTLELPKAKWAGVEYTANFFNWSNYKGLEINILNPWKQMEIRISFCDDKKSTSYFSRFTTSRILVKGENKIIIPFLELNNFPFNRKFNLKRISKIRIFTNSSNLPAFIQIGKVRLYK